MQDHNESRDQRTQTGFPRTGKRATDCVVNTMRAGNMLLERVQRICQQYGLTLSTANILAIIEGAGQPLPAHVISSRLVITSGAVTQFLDILEKRSLIRRLRNPSDRRSVLIEITEEGKRVREGLGPELSDLDEQWTGGLSAEEQDQLIHLLEKLQVHLQTVENVNATPQT